MNWQFSLISILDLATAGLTLVLAVYIWRHRSSAPTARPLIALLLIAGWWAAMHALELAAPGQTLKVLFSKLEYLSIVSLPGAWLVLAQHYTQRGAWLTPGRLAALAIVPGLSLLLVFTTEWHGLMWYDLRLESAGGLNTLAVEHGAWFWVHAAYSYGLLLAGTLILFRSLQRASALYSRQGAAVIVGALAPWVGNLLYLGGFVPVDVTPLAFSLSALTIAWALFRYHLLDLTPIARAAVVEGLRDAVIVLDAQNRVMDLNPSAEKLLQIAPDRYLGQAVGQLGEWAAWVAGQPLEVDVQQEVTLAAAASPRFFEARLSPLLGPRDQPTGRLLVLRDITERRQIQEERRKLTALVEYSTDLTGMSDQRGQMLYLNAAGQRLLGVMDPAEVVGRPITELFPPEEAMLFRQRIRPYAAGGSVWTSEFRIRHKQTGAQIPVQFSYFPVHAADTHAPLAYGIICRDITAQRARESERRAEAAKQRAILDAIPDLLLRLNREGAILGLYAAKEGGEAAAGHEVWGRHLSQSLPSEVAQSFQEMLTRVLDSDDIGIFEYRLRVPLTSGGSAARDFEARIVGSGRDEVVALVRDITERKRSEAELARYADEMATLYRASQEIGARLDPEAIYEAAHRGAIRLIPSDVLVIAVRDELTQDIEIPFFIDHGTRRPPLRLRAGAGLSGHVMATGRVVRVDDLERSPEVPRLLVGHTERVRSVLAVPLQQGERTFGMLALQGDQPYAYTLAHEQMLLTLSNQVAAALQNARLYQAIATERSQLDALIRSNRDGVVLIGLDRRVLVVNTAALTILDLPGRPEDWTGHPLQEVLLRLRRNAPDAVRATLTEMRRIRDGREPAGEGEYVVEPRAIRWLNLPVISGEAALGRLLVLRDVTEVRLLEKMRADLTHTMVHDLRNPLASMSAALSMVDTGNVGSPHNPKLIDIAQQASQQMLELVNAILDVSRLESGQMPLDRSVVSLAAVAREVLQVQLPLAQNNGLLLESSLPDDLPALSIDPALARRVLQNLIGNAIKFTPRGGRICLSAQPASAGWLRVTVTDTGPGIPLPLQSRLFDKFVTGSNPSSGTGLGLTFCRLAVEAHGGQIWLESALGQGTSFHFTLPAAA